MVRNGLSIAPRISAILPHSSGCPFPGTNSNARQHYSHNDPEFVLRSPFLKYSRGQNATENRMKEAMHFLTNKRNKEGTWNLNAAHPGQVHLKMEASGKPSRWNTLRMLRIMKHFEIEIDFIKSKDQLNN